MDKKLKECFKPHVVIHSLFGLGLGIVLAAIVPGFRTIWFGLVFMGIAFILDYMRK